MMDKRPLRTTRNLATLRKDAPGWYRIKAQAGGPAVVTIYDEIGFLAVSAQNFLSDLADVDGDIEMHINSPGGDIHEGITIYNQLRQRKGVVSVIVDGLAASAASFIAQAASPGELAMAPHSQMMIHLGFGMGIGTAQDMRDYADLLDKASNNIARIYAGRSGKPAEYWLDRMQAETWYDDHEAVAEGLADKILGQDPPRAKWDLSVYSNWRNADGSIHPPMTITHSHDHPDMDGGTHGHMHVHDGDNAHAPHEQPWDPDGDGDDDTHAETDTDHDHWTHDGHPVTNQAAARRFFNEKYSAEDRRQMAAKGHAMPDGSYPIADEEDLHNAIHAVGRGGADHDAIRRHIIKRANALGKSDAIPDNWNSDGSISGLSSDHIWTQLFGALEGSE